MDIIIALGALVLLMLAAYRGYSVILFAPIVAMLAVLVTNPADVGPVFSGLFMEKMVVFIKLYFPALLLGAIFGKVIEISGFSSSIVLAFIRLFGNSQAILVTVLVCALLTYGGVSTFVVAFAVYPFAAELFRQSDIPKRLLPATITLGAFSFTMGVLPGTPQIQNIIPTSFFGTNALAAPWLGVIGSLFIVIVGISWLEYRRRSAKKHNEGYAGEQALLNEPQASNAILPHPLIALLPLVVVGVANWLLTQVMPCWYGGHYLLSLPGLNAPLEVNMSNVSAVMAVELSLLIGIVLVLIFGFRNIFYQFAEGTKTAVSGALLATMNTAAEYGFGAVIAALPGFVALSKGMQVISNPLLNESVSVTVLAGITGSASGGMSIALGAMPDKFLATVQAAGIPLEVLHRVAAMASGGMDTLPHNGAVLTLFAITGLTHKQSYGDIFAITIIKTLAVLVVIGVFYLTGLV